MKIREDIIKKLKEYSSDTQSKLREKAKWRLANKSWLRYSQRIAMMMLDKMEELDVTQRDVAERMGCSEEFISRVLKGSENLSVETISKIEQALGLEILKPFFSNMPNQLTLAAMKEAETSDNLETLDLSNFKDFINSLEKNS